MKLKIVASNALVAGTLLTALTTAPKHLVDKEQTDVYCSHTESLHTAAPVNPSCGTV